MMRKDEAVKLADFVEELINGLQFHCDLKRRIYDKKTKKTIHRTYRNCYVDLSKTVAGASVRDGVLGYLGYEDDSLPAQALKCDEGGEAR